MSKEEILNKLKNAVEEMEVETAEEAAREAVKAGLDPLETIENGLAPAMETISDLFDQGEMFVPQILIAAEAFEKSVAILTENMSQEEMEKSKKGKVIVHTVQGDIHDIGKNIVATLLAANGFEVIDLGRDVPVEEVIEKAKEENVDMVTGSALMTTTMPSQRDIVNLLKEEGIRDNVKVMFGGAPVTKEWVDRIGGDGYGESAAEAVALAKELLS